MSATAAAALGPVAGPAAADVPAALSALADSLRRSTVEVRLSRSGAGSGVIWSADGLIVTNAHVARADRARVVLWDGRELDGTVTARDPHRDLAALAVPADHLPAATVGDARPVRAGDLVAALGNPLGIAGALALGIVHVVEPGAPAADPRWIRADIRLAPGNSGGPLADARGRVIGINTLIAAGLGVAVPSGTVARFLAATGRRPRLGVVLRRVSVDAGGAPVAGLLVIEVAPAGPADAAGVLPGDVLIAVDGRRIPSVEDLLTATEQARPHTPIELELLRGRAVVRRHVIVQPAPVPSTRAA